MPRDWRYDRLVLCRLLIVLLLPGCDLLFQLQHVDPTPDAPRGAWQPATQILELGSPGDEADPSMTGDRLVMLFSSTRSGGLGGFDLYLASRELPNDPFDTPVLLGDLSTGGGDHGFLSDDGLTIYLNRADDIWRASRPDRASPFDAAILDTELSTTSADYNPAIAANGLWAVTDHDDEMFLYTRQAKTDSWGAPEQLSALSSPGLDAAPTLDADGLILVFHSDRVAGEARNIYISERATPMEPFTIATPITVLNSLFNESDPHITSDGRAIVFTRNNEIFISTR